MNMHEALNERKKVAVIGIGLSGLAAIKNLLEQGFEVTAYERNDSIGGLWRFRSDPDQTTVLKSTVSNTPKSFSCYQDFPFPEGFPDFPTAGQICEYLELYAKHFDLLRHCQFGTVVRRVKRDADRPGPWSVEWAHKQESGGAVNVDWYDRILVTTGPYAKPLVPTVQGKERFRGEIIHAQAYKDSSRYTGQRVLVVGMSNSGCDTAVDVAKVASKVYMSHRNGARIVKRYIDSRPLHDNLTRRRTYIMRRLGSMASSVVERNLEQTMRSIWPRLDPSWRLLPAPPDVNSNAVINEDFVPALETGSIISVGGLKTFTEDGVLTDLNEQIQVDVVVFSTGYTFDYSIFDRESDPTKHPTPEWDESPHSNGLPYPWLYQTLFSPKSADALAFIGPCEGYTFAAFCHADLASQAIARVWAGNFSLPSQQDMNKWCEDNYRLSLRRIERYRVPKTGSDQGKLEAWLNKAAGNQVEDKLGWGLQGWKFWWSDRELHKLIMDGRNTPFVYRLFEGDRGSRIEWKGARSAVLAANGS